MQTRPILVVVQPGDGAVVVQGASVVTGLRAVAHRVGAEVSAEGGNGAGVEEKCTIRTNWLIRFQGICKVAD